MKLEKRACFVHEMAFGLLPIFIPLYVVRTLGGSLVELGTMTSLADEIKHYQPIGFIIARTWASIM
jgi:hypothetical protein